MAHAESILYNPPVRRLAFAGLAILTSCAAPASREAAGPDLDAAGEEAVTLLGDLLRIDTINPPAPGSGKANAGETAVCRRVKAALASWGVDAEIVESAPGRGNLVARIRGTGAKKPLLLMAHVDVVGVERASWTTDPLSGEVRDGFLWGRGALDDKDDAAVFAVVLGLLARSGERLSRDVILMLNADEESSGTWGARWMVENRWPLIDCEAVVSEGGSAGLRGGKIAQYGFMTAEKIYNDFRIWTRGKAGHSSVPQPKNAIYAAARIAQKMESFRTPIRLTPTVAANLAGLADQPAYGSSREFMKKAAAGDLAAADELTKEPRFNAQLRSTFVPTIARGGIRENVLAEDVEINFNARLLPGDKIDVLIKELMAHAGVEKYEVVEGHETKIAAWKAANKDVDVAVFLVDRGLEAPASPLDTEAFAALGRTAKRMSPEAVVVPQMATGATDLRFFRAKGVPGYGIAPCPTGEEEERTVHGHNERVRVASVKFGVRFVWDFVRDYCR
jgi:acetylornithine deacetylase/succinyl-diaminopimelate desuccinylase-like protein